MSGLIGHRGAKSAMVGDGGRVRVDQLDTSRTQSAGNGTTSHVLDFSPKAGINMGSNGTSTVYGIGWGIFSSTPVGTASNNTIGNTTSTVRNQNSTTDFGRWEGPYITAASSTPSNEGQLYRQTAGSNYMWQYKVSAINDDGIDIYWQKPVATSETGYVRLLVVR